MINYRNILIFCFSILYTGILTGQHTISGFVQNKDSKEDLIQALVLDPESNVGVWTNEFGFYSITVKGPKLKLQASYVGYESDQIEIILTGDTMVNFLLNEMYLNEVEVVQKNEIQNIHLGGINMPIKYLKKIPSLLGQPDILRNLSILPGVSLGSEGSSNLFVRGGTPDQNLILLDDVVVYNVNHLGGFFSVFNPDALNNIKLFKGGFPARYGGRLSSILDIRMKEGNKNNCNGKFGIGLLTSNLLLEGPIKKQRSSFLFAARASYLGIINLFRKNQDVNFNYWLYDINLKSNFSLKKGKLFFSFYTGNDIGTSSSDSPTSTVGSEIIERTKSKSKITWGNTTFTSRYYNPISSKLFFSVLGGYTQYRFKNQAQSESELYGEIDTLIRSEIADQSNNIEDFILKSHLDFIPNSVHQFRIGAAINLRQFNTESYSNMTLSDNTSFTSSNFEFKVYAEDLINWNKVLSTNVGVHLNTYFSNEQSFTSIQPRLLTKFQITKEASLQCAYAFMQQNIHLLTNSGFSFPGDIWIPATSNAVPSSSHQFDVGILIETADNLQVNLEAFYKKQNNLIEFKNNQDDILANIKKWESLIEKNGTGTITGLELMVKKDFGKWNGLFAYTLSKNQQKFENINSGKSYYFDFHRPHDLNINISYTFNKKWSSSMNWIYQSGRRITLPVGIVQNPGINSGTTFLYAEKNNGKFKDYHRLDIGIVYNKKKKKDREVKWIFNIYNLYNRKNTNYIRFDSTEVFDDQNNFLYTTRKIKSVSLFSFIPSLSYRSTL